MKTTSTVFLINPPDLVNRLCSYMLPENSFCESLAIVEDSGAQKKFSGWEMTLSELKCVYQKASASQFDTNFKVAIRRINMGPLRFMKRSEWLPHVVQRGKIKRKLNRVLKKRTVKSTFGFMK